MSFQALQFTFGEVGFEGGKTYFYGLTVTFAIYVFYDLSKQLNFAVSSEILSYVFFVATLAALWSAWGAYKK